jgi:GT2 family glycosyltransferase
MEKAHRLGKSGKASNPGSLFYSGNVSLHRSDFDRAGGFDPKLLCAEDADLGQRLYQLGVRFVFDSDAVVVHHGYRTCERWRDMHRKYGQLWAQVGQRPGQERDLADDMASRYRARHPLSRTLVYLLVGRSRASSAAAIGLGTLGCVSYALHRQRVSKWCFSAAAIVLRWQGVADVLGGRDRYFEVLASASPRPQLKAPIQAGKP